MNQQEWRESVEWIGIIAANVIKQDGKYLMVQEDKPHVKGLWNVPAGYVDVGEEVEQAAVREAKEESGYDVVIDDLIDLYHDTTTEPMKHVYASHVVGGELKAQEGEIMSVEWLTYDEIKTLNDEGKLRARWIFDAISKFEDASS